MVPINDCVYCKATTKLNTELRLSFDGGESAVVKVCDQCADEASIKSAKECFSKRQDEINTILEMAKKAGLQFVMPSSGSQLTLASKTQEVIQENVSPSSQQNAAPRKAALLKATDESEVVISVEKAEKDSYNPNITMEQVALERHNQHRIGLVSPNQEEAEIAARVSQARLSGQVKMKAVQARDGQVIPVPVVRQDGLGTTHIQISRNFDDGQLQKRFKRIAKASVDGNSISEVSECPQCRGENPSCTRCQGSGFLS